jgi:ubiquitin-like protein ATG12
MEKTAVSGVSTDPTTTTSRESQQDVVKETSKVLLFLRPVGEVAGLRKTRYKLDGSKAIVEVEKFLRKTLEMSADQSIFIYCGSGFSPTPDQNLQDLFDNFQTNGELIVNYGIQEAWG